MTTRPPDNSSPLSLFLWSERLFGENSTSVGQLTVAQIDTWHQKLLLNVLLMIRNLTNTMESNLANPFTMNFKCQVSFWATVSFHLELEFKPNVLLESISSCRQLGFDTFCLDTHTRDSTWIPGNS